MTPAVDLCLCVLVRDEAERLDRLLGRHRELWDSAVVVDTGSRDASPDVAGRWGAAVVRFPWCDDFSAARNAGLAACRGRWVLVLDCDEAIAAADFAALRALTAGVETGAYTLVQKNYSDDAGAPDWRPCDGAQVGMARGALGYVPVHSIRLFYNADTVAYAGRVHETLERSLVSSGLTVRDGGLAVHHWGHQDDGERCRRRLERDGALLRRQIRETPADPAVRRQMAVQLLREGRPDLAVRLLEQTVREAPSGPQVPRARRLLARLLAEAGRPREAMAQAELALQQRPDLLDGWLDAIRLASAGGDKERARRLWKSARQLFPAEARLGALEAQVFCALADNQ